MKTRRFWAGAGRATLNAFAFSAYSGEQQNMQVLTTSNKTLTDQTIYNQTDSSSGNKTDYEKHIASPPLFVVWPEAKTIIQGGKGNENGGFGFQVIL